MSRFVQDGLGFLRLDEPVSTEEARNRWSTATQETQGKQFQDIYNKSSTATDWLEENPEDLDELIDLLQAAGVPGWQIVTELPDSVKDRIVGSLRKSFEQDYWDEISESTGGAAERILERGLQEGASIRDMAREIRESLGGDDYARVRSFNIARTETTSCLNESRSEAINDLKEGVGDRIAIKRTWMSVLGSTTRDAHADLDGVPEDEDGEWDLNGVAAKFPGDPGLPPGDRCNCQCSVTVEFGMEDEEAKRLIDNYYSEREAREGEASTWTVDKALDYLQEKGGQGSGNYGHSGRSGGEVGGSGAGVNIKPAKKGERAFNGEPVPLKTKISKQESGRLGEAIIIAVMKSEGKKDARHLNVKLNNFPIDLIQDHESVEAKTGLVSNAKDAQKWRMTIGEPGKQEKEWLKNATPEQKAKWNKHKEEKIVERKDKALKDLSKELGKPVKAKTMTVLLNPDTKTADIFEFEGWHPVIRWNSPEAKAAYKKTVKYA